MTCSVRSLPKKIEIVDRAIPHLQSSARFRPGMAPRRYVRTVVIFALTVAFAVSMTAPSSPPSSNQKNEVPSAPSPPIENPDSGDMLFGRFEIPSGHIFLRTRRSAAFVNLRPIVPGHVLVVPETIVPTMDRLSAEEYTDLWLAVRRVQEALKEHFKVSAFNVAVQDGEAAGQSVPHVHVHILPRKSGDLERNDDVYDELEAWVPKEGMAKAKQKIEVPDDEDREDRTVEIMEAEAANYRSIIQSLELGQ